VRLIAYRREAALPPTAATVAAAAAFLTADADVTLLYVRSNAETTTPYLHDGRGKEMDQQVICELNLALIPVTELSSRHLTFAMVNSLRGSLLRERDPAGRPR
jgi:hypothetical protein